MRYGPVALILCLAWAAGCGGGPTSPTAVNVAGNWTGTWKFVTSGVTVTDNVTAAFTQSGASVNGTWTAESGPTGSMSFQVGSTFTGSFTISQTTLGGATCTATATLSGQATSSSLEVTVVSIPASSTCSWASNHQFSLHK